MEKMELMKRFVESDEISETSECDSVNIHDSEQVHVYTLDDPYQIISINEEENLYQVLGNEIITITKGLGLCCLCKKDKSPILYTDNSYGMNIPVQICMDCIKKILL